VDARYKAADVLDNIAKTLSAAFAFSSRDFGQMVTAAEVVAAIQGVAGVVSTDLNQLYFVTDPNGPAQTEPPAILPADRAHWESGQIVKAQLLLLNPVGINLTELKP
jgi:hypothetical protein